MAARDFPGPSDHDRQPHQREVTVTTQLTEIDQISDLEISRQRAAFEALAVMAATFANLPGGYITVHSATSLTPYPRISLQMDTGQAFEQWRIALQIDPATVTLHRSDSRGWLAADGEFAGIPVHMTGHHLPLTDEQAAEPRDLTAVTA
jgi:hypothetical protein